MSEASDAWDAGLKRLVEDEIARQVGDIRAHLISEIAGAMASSDALLSADPDRLAEVAVDVVIEFSRKGRSGGNYSTGGSSLI